MKYYAYFSASVGIFAVRATNRAAADRIAYWNAGKSTFLEETEDASRVEGYDIFE